MSKYNKMTSQKKIIFSFVLAFSTFIKRTKIFVFRSSFIRTIIFCRQKKIVQGKKKLSFGKKKLSKAKKNCPSEFCSESSDSSRNLKINFFPYKKCQNTQLFSVNLLETLKHSIGKQQAYGLLFSVELLETLKLVFYHIFILC